MVKGTPPAALTPSNGGVVEPAPVKIGEPPVTVPPTTHQAVDNTANPLVPVPPARRMREAIYKKAKRIFASTEPATAICRRQ